MDIEKKLRELQNTLVRLLTEGATVNLNNKSEIRFVVRGEKVWEDDENEYGAVATGIFLNYNPRWILIGHLDSVYSKEFMTDLYGELNEENLRKFASDLFVANANLTLTKI